MHDVRTRLFLSSLWLLLLVALLSGALLGCSTAGYYGQAAVGHWRIMRARLPVQTVIDDPVTAEQTRVALLRAAAARAFASEQLALPENASYTTYVDIRREAVTWNVVATKPFSVEPERWCFPIAGCLSYRGYFHREDAERYAVDLREQGLDVALTQSDAYSSLGWFDDPLLSTMLRRGEPLLAGVIFHELAHQQLYVKGDSAFNESFASFVEQQGLRDWLRHQDRADLQRRYTAYQNRRQGFVAQLKQLRSQLEALYRTALGVDEMARAKEQAFDEFRRDYALLKEEWGGYAGYDKWFEKPLNNARVASVSTYNKWVGAFATIFVDSGENYARFYQLSAAIAAMPGADRRSLLEEKSSRNVLWLSEPGF